MFCNLAFEYIREKIIDLITLQDYPSKTELYETDCWADRDQKVKWQIPFTAFGNSRPYLRCQFIRQKLNFWWVFFSKALNSKMKSSKFILKTFSNPFLLPNVYYQSYLKAPGPQVKYSLTCNSYFNYLFFYRFNQIDILSSCSVQLIHISLISKLFHWGTGKVMHLVQKMLFKCLMLIVKTRYIIYNNI